MKAVMNKETVEVNIKEQLAQLISKYNASQQSLADSARALNQKYKEDVQANTYTTGLSPDNPSVYGCGSDDEACGEPLPQSDGYVLLLH